VQFGSISKFGLLEMSRQRLRPALSEGASIPCPRCGGAGHIRDTESSALQILRIIQEDAMKDNTAAVHCQVPVEVASFLLNEKRSEIAKIEMKQRIAVLLVPNKTLETPNYKLERLKHDDPRLDNIAASYKMAEEFEDPTTVTRRSQEKSNKQEPVIKGVLPDAPAPVVSEMPKPQAPRPVPAATPAPSVGAEKGFFSWVKGLFGATPAPVSPASQSAAAEPSGDKREGRSGERAGRDGRRGERGRGRGGEPRGEPRLDQRAERGGEVRTGSGSEAREGADNRRRGSRTQGDRPAEGQRSEASNTREDRDGRSSRGRRERGERGDRNERGAQTAGEVSQEELAAANLAAMQAAGSPSSSPRGEAEGRRERSERPRRERGERPLPTGDHSEAMGAEVVAQDGASLPQAQDDQAPQRERRSRDRQGRDRRERGPRHEEGASAPQTTPTDASQQPGPEPVTRSNADETAARPTQQVSLPQVQAYELPLDDLMQVASGSGLQWIHSQPEKVAQAQAAIAAEPRPVHIPRERPPLPQIEEGPLILVETRRDLRELPLPFETQR
jgi:ribonuclease E